MSKTGAKKKGNEKFRKSNGVTIEGEEILNENEKTRVNYSLFGLKFKKKGKMKQVEIFL